MQDIIHSKSLHAVEIKKTGRLLSGSLLIPNWADYGRSSWELFVPQTNGKKLKIGIYRLHFHIT